MIRGPEGLSPVDNSETPPNRFFSFARKLRNISSEIVDHYKRASIWEKASVWFMGAAFVDISQAVINSYILNPDPLKGLIESMSDLGMITAAYNLRHSPLKKLAFIEGSLGAAGSALIKTGNPDLFYPALICAGLSMFLGMPHFGSAPDSRISSQTRRLPLFQTPIRVFKPPYGWTDIPGYDFWGEWDV